MNNRFTSLRLPNALRCRLTVASGILKQLEYIAYTDFGITLILIQLGSTNFNPFTQLKYAQFSPNPKKQSRRVLYPPTTNYTIPLFAQPAICFCDIRYSNNIAIE
ncbi:MAG: hypothetical protein LBJ00_13925 [Planctomycetaceae bacterium]|nr:hypothetical protein [Planctomycetaceae bacterium]